MITSGMNVTFVSFKIAIKLLCKFIGTFLTFLWILKVCSFKTKSDYSCKNTTSKNTVSLNTIFYFIHALPQNPQKRITTGGSRSKEGGG